MAYIENIFAASKTTAVIVQPCWETLDGVTIKTAGYKFYKDGEGEFLTKDNLKYEANTATGDGD